jgi:hypothetical protein
MVAEVYDPENDSYEELPHPCAIMTPSAAVVLGNICYCIGIALP